MVTADYHGNSVSVLLNTGGGVLAEKTSYTTVSGSETSNLAVGDLNGDGNLDVIGDFDGSGTADLAIADVRSATIVVRLGNGDGSFGPEVPYLEGGVPRTS